MITEHPIGIVSSIKDPAKAGRIKVRLPEMDGDEYPEWIEPLFTPGMVAMPDVGDSVELVLPEGEDKIEFPEEVRYRGKLFNDANPVPDDFKENYPKRRGFFTKAGHFLIFDDDDGIVLTVGTGGGNNIGISIDASSGAVQIFGTSLVQIKATAHVAIEGLSCSILGRPVSPIGGPI